MYKTYSNPKKGTVVAVLEHEGLDAIAFVSKRLGLDVDETLDDMVFCKNETLNSSLHMDKLFMNETSVGVAKCHPKDTFNEEEGERVALEKADGNYYRSFKKALKRWQVSMMKHLYQISPDTFEKATQEVDKWVKSQS